MIQVPKGLKIITYPNHENFYKNRHINEEDVENILSFAKRILDEKLHIKDGSNNEESCKKLLGIETKYSSSSWLYEKNNISISQPIVDGNITIQPRIVFNILIEESTQKVLSYIFINPFHTMSFFTIKNERRKGYASLLLEDLKEKYPFSETKIVWGWDEISEIFFDKKKFLNFVSIDKEKNIYLDQQRKKLLKEKNKELLKKYYGLIYKYKDYDFVTYKSFATSIPTKFKAYIVDRGKYADNQEWVKVSNKSKDKQDKKEIVCIDIKNPKVLISKTILLDDFSFVDTDINFSFNFKKNNYDSFIYSKDRNFYDVVLFNPQKQISHFEF